MENGVENAINISNKIYSTNKDAILEFIADLKEILCNIKNERTFKKMETVIVNLNKFINDYNKKVNILHNALKELTSKNEKKKIELLLKNGKYFGETMNRIMEGKGKFFYKNGDTYDGFWKNGVKEGRGIYIYKNGDLYEGDFKNDKFEGKGIIYYNDGDIYDGNFSNGLWHGKGIYYYINGKIYEGDWKEGMKSGKGIVYYPNGDRKMGNYSSNQKVGKHVILTKSGEIFSDIYE
jgi:hypothetical protein